MNNLRASGINPMDDHRAHESQFQIQHFVVDRAGTTWGQYQQALRQIDTMQSAMIDDRVAIEELRDAIANGRPHGTALERARHRANQVKLERAERIMREKERNFAFLVSLATTLRAELGDLTEDRKAQLEAELWEYRLRMKAAIDMLLGGAVSADTMELMLACPIDIRARLVAALEHPQELRTWALNHDSAKLMEMTDDHRP